MTGNASAWPVPFFFGGRRCLDFVNTVNSRSRPPTRDYLPDWSALIGWCRQTALFDGTVVSGIDNLAWDAPQKAARAHAEAVVLRETLYRLFLAVIDRKKPATVDFDRLNAWLRQARGRQVLVGGQTGFHWVWDRSRLDLQAPLHAIALSAGELLTGDQLNRLKQCPGPEGCGWLFYDETKNGARRWCSMAHCGSAAKARRYATRHGASDERSGR